jgi:dihydrofolate reductase
MRNRQGGRARYAALPPVFVVTHRAPETARLGPRFAFVTGGLAAAIQQARAAAGPKDVFVMGGGDVIRQCVAAGLADELKIHLAPIVLGSGTPLFTGSDPIPLVQHSVQPSPTAAHLTYELRAAQARETQTSS